MGVWASVALGITRAGRKWEVGHGCLALAKLDDVEFIRWGLKLQHKYPTSMVSRNGENIVKMR